MTPSRPASLIAAANGGMKMFSTSRGEVCGSVRACPSRAPFDAL